MFGVGFPKAVNDLKHPFTAARRLAASRLRQYGSELSLVCEFARPR